MTDDQLLRLHWWGFQARRVGAAVFAVFAFLAVANDWPKWAVWLTLFPAWLVLAAGGCIVPFCGWLEERRGWSERGEMIW